MSLSSWLFLLGFLPLSAIAITLARHRFGESGAWMIALLASTGFALSSGITDLLALTASVVCNAALARKISGNALHSNARSRWLKFALVSNAGSLAFFKFAAPSALLLGVPPAAVTEFLPAGIPLGFSFYTITQVMYLVDLADGLIEPPRFIDYAAFVSFFPTLTAGPIQRFGRFFDQRRNLGLPGEFSGGQRAAIVLIALGLVKKVALGDSFGRIANFAYADTGIIGSTLGAWGAAIAGAFEVYFDFSGYSDMALGVAGLLGLSLSRNFNAPFRSTDISDFWRRWHISLSSFITAYLYTPILRALGRPSVHTAAFAAVTSMLIAGVWHGASWNYVAFGLLHGLALAVLQYWRRLRRPLPDGLSHAITFIFVVFAFVTVKTESLQQSTMVWSAMISAHTLPPSAVALLASALSPDLFLISASVPFGIVLAFIGPTSDELSAHTATSPYAVTVASLALTIAFIFMMGSAATEFRYRQF